jgi:DNA-directed RNA polymerase specialized sigma24 family protein
VKHSIDGHGLSRTQVLDLIDSYIFNERNRHLLVRRFLDGITYEDLAEEFELSVNQVKTICYKGIEKILVRMKY